MTRAEQNADHSPEEAAKATQKEALAHPGIDGEINLIHVLLNPLLFKHSDDGLLIEKSFMPGNLLPLSIVENLGRDCP